MKRYIIYLFVFLAVHASAQDPWSIKVNHIDPQNYYGVTVANGMLGIVSSPEPLRTSQVVLAGSYDKYGRGRVSNFLNGYNMLNATLSIDGQTLRMENISSYTQELDMKEAIHRSSFRFGNKAEVTYSFLALRQLPYSALLVIEITPHADITISATNIHETPDAFRDGQMYYNEINRKHASVKLMSTQAMSPTGKLKICASSSFLFPEKAGEEPRDRAGEDVVQRRAVERRDRVVGVDDHRDAVERDDVLDRGPPRIAEPGRGQPRGLVVADRPRRQANVAAPGGQPGERGGAALGADVDDHLAGGQGRAPRHHRGRCGRAAHRTHAHPRNCLPHTRMAFTSRRGDLRIA